MNLLLSNIETLKIGDEAYPTVSILGEPPLPINQNCEDEEIIQICCKNKTQSFLVNQSEICLFKTNKNIDSNVDTNEDIQLDVSMIKAPSNFDNIFDISSDRTDQKQKSELNLNEEREKRRQRRNHLNKVDDMVDKIDKIKNECSSATLRLKRSTSYNEINQSQRVRNNKSVIRNQELTRMASNSPIQHQLSSKNIKASHQSILEKISDHKDKFVNQKMKVFELKNVTYNVDQSPTIDSRKNIENADKGDTEKVVTRLRNLRYK